MADFDEEAGHNIEELVGVEEEEKKRRAIPPLLLFALLAAAAVAAGLAAYLWNEGPDVVERIKSRDCLTCHAELVPDFSRESVHRPFVALNCLSCHTEHGLDLIKSITITEKLFGRVIGLSEKNGKIPRSKVTTSDKAPRPKKISKLVENPKQLCADACHDDLMKMEKEKTYQMEPFKKKLCLSCHQPHASDQDDLLLAATKPLCLSCHEEISKYYRKTYKHRPFAAGDCTGCHRGHASNVAGLLRRNPKVLCMSCHPSIASLMNLPSKMEPFETGNCPQCHNPHASEYKKLLEKPVPTLCFDCHAKIEKLQNKPVQMPPFRQGLCLGCHRPHASENLKLLLAPLKNNEMCYLCHENIRGNYLSIGHNRVLNNGSRYQPEAGIGSCLNCHEPHAADFTGLIQKEEIALCLSCHGPRRYFAHPIGLAWQDPWRGGYLRCTSCHNPMGSGLFRLKRRNRDALCLSCHEAEDPSYIFSEREAWHYRIPGSIF
ncbi:MAG TPA: hypothetical protein ENI11_00080 [Actinobacteria bacterium]|nr:hypothetical protein [Actinomycetota bacterium]